MVKINDDDNNKHTPSIGLCPNEVMSNGRCLAGTITPYLWNQIERALLPTRRSIGMQCYFRGFKIQLTYARSSSSLNSNINGQFRYCLLNFNTSALRGCVMLAVIRGRSNPLRCGSTGRQNSKGDVAWSWLNGRSCNNFNSQFTYII